MKKYAIKCKTNSGHTFYFCHQIIFGAKQNVFVSNINQALFYTEKQIDLAEMELLKNLKFNDVKSYTIEIL